MDHIIVITFAYCVVMKILKINKVRDRAIRSHIELQRIAEKLCTRQYFNVAKLMLNIPITGGIEAEEVLCILPFTKVNAGFKGIKRGANDRRSVWQDFLNCFCKGIGGGTNTRS